MHLEIIDNNLVMQLHTGGISLPIITKLDEIIETQVEWCTIGLTPLIEVTHLVNKLTGTIPNNLIEHVAQIWCTDVDHAKSVIYDIETILCTKSSLLYDNINLAEFIMPDVYNAIAGMIEYNGECQHEILDEFYVEVNLPYSSLVTDILINAYNELNYYYDEGVNIEEIDSILEPYKSILVYLLACHISGNIK